MSKTDVPSAQQIELRTNDQIFSLLASVSRIAVLGMKTEEQAEQPAFYVPKYMLEAGYDIVPVPVYYPHVTSILGCPVFRSLAAVPPPRIDLVNVFRRSRDVAPHLPDILAARPRAVWLQQGIRDDAVAEELLHAGIQVVQDACILVMHRQYRAAFPHAPAPGALSVTATRPA